MKKSLFFAVFMLISSISQAQIYPQGSVNVSAGYGVVSYGNIVLKLFETTLDLKNVSSNLTGPIISKVNMRLRIILRWV